jgi:hypothetical protein
MGDLRDRLERESERVRLAPGAADRMFERGRRRERTRRGAALVVGLSLTVTIAVVAIQAAQAPREIGTPVTPGPDTTGNEVIAGTYTIELPESDADVSRLGLEGSYTLRLRPNGVLLLSVPERANIEGTSSVLFRLSGNVFTTNVFSNFECAEGVGTYAWSLVGGELRFAPIDEPCELRAVILASRPWIADSTP